MQIDSSCSQPNTRTQCHPLLFFPTYCNFPVPFLATCAAGTQEGNPRMDADAELLEALVIMFTVITFGLLVIMGVFRIRRFTCSLLFSVLAAFWAWGLIEVKRLNFWLQRTGRFDQMFSLMQIHVFEIVSFLMLLLILLFSIRSYLPNLRGILRMVMTWFGNHPGRSPALLFLVGLAITGYGMGVFLARGLPANIFHGDFGVFITVIGLMVVTAGVWTHRDPVGQMAGASLAVYILVLLVSSCMAGDW
ncbi:hypothetical protein SETIT_2G115600v2 [Setaria italica]|uniref:Uncharacterized protein n=2 Tax=Setaria italica TaxID=4555 RepID=A0A368PZU1_SETIT|nr:hypothetical protein SETIT_2G115600v2 [Setaria italica]